MQRTSHYRAVQLIAPSQVAGSIFRQSRDSGVIWLWRKLITEDNRAWCLANRKQTRLSNGSCLIATFISTHPRVGAAGDVARLIHFPHQYVSGTGRQNGSGNGINYAAAGATIDGRKENRVTLLLRRIKYYPASQRDS